jgi:hypothetical protein
MSEETTSKSGKTWLYVVGWLVSIPLLYVLSVGPIAVLVHRKLVPVSAVEPAYTPLFWLFEKTHTGEAMTAYMEAWMKLTGTPFP